MAAERDAARKRGGVNRSNRARMKKALPADTLSGAELHALLGGVLRRVIARELDPSIGNCAANLARSLVSVQEAVELQSRIAALEQRAGLAGTPWKA
jgi:hypothetical protein